MNGRDEALHAAWQEFLTVMGLKDEQMTLGERLLFNVAFERGRKSVSSKNVVPINAAARSKH